MRTQSVAPATQARCAPYPGCLAGAEGLECCCFQSGKDPLWTRLQTRRPLKFWLLIALGMLKSGKFLIAVRFCLTGLRLEGPAGA